MADVKAGLGQLIENALWNYHGDPRERYRDPAISAEGFYDLPAVAPLPPRDPGSLRSAGHGRPTPEWQERAAASVSPVMGGIEMSRLLEHMRQSIDAGDVHSVMDALPFAAMAFMPMAKGGAGRGKSATPAVSKMAPPPESKFFDLRHLDRVNEDVPQVPLERYEPPRGLPERTQDLISNAAVRRKIRTLMGEGALAGGERWYGTQPLLDSFLDVLGERLGPQRFKLFMDMVAATSPTNAVKPNIRAASDQYATAIERERQGRPMPEVGEPVTPGYGGKAQKLWQLNAQKVGPGGEGFDPFVNPKPFTFTENLQGNRVPVTVDTHNTRLPAMLAKDPRWLMGDLRVESPEGGFVPRYPKREFEAGDLTLAEALKAPTLWNGKPMKTEYGALEKMYQDEAKKEGLTGSGGQASTWVTQKNVRDPRPWMEIFQELLLDKARENKEPPMATLKRFIKGNQRLAVPGAAVPLAGTVLSQYDDASPEQIGHGPLAEYLLNSAYPDR